MNFVNFKRVFIACLSIARAIRGTLKEKLHQECCLQSRAYPRNNKKSVLINDLEILHIGKNPNEARHCRTSVERSRNSCGRSEGAQLRENYATFNLILAWQQYLQH